MAITYPLTPPSGIKRLKVVPVNFTALLRSPWTGVTTTQQHPGKMWAAEVTVALKKWDQAAAWAAFLTKLKGPYGTFYLGNKTATLRGAATGTPLVNGSVAQRSETITTQGRPAGGREEGGGRAA